MFQRLDQLQQLKFFEQAIAHCHVLFLDKVAYRRKEQYNCEDTKIQYSNIISFKYCCWTQHMYRRKLRVSIIQRGYINQKLAVDLSSGSDLRNILTYLLLVLPVVSL